VAAPVLLERSGPLAALADAWADVRTSGRGRLVLVPGEAGVGKSALLASFLGSLDGASRVLVGRCDALFTPRPLGPFVDVVEQLGGRVRDLVGSGARPHEVLAELLVELRREPTVLALEDLQWADEASLDVLTLLGRRLAGSPTLVLATYRDDELGPAHPLRLVLGELGTGAAVSRVPLRPLSRTAVAELLGGSGGATVDDLYATTGGNPFFVTEAVAAGAGSAVAVPVSVRDAVLARAARLGRAARAVLDGVAVVPQPCEYWLLGRLAGDDADAVDECLAAGMLTAGPTALQFRHELARLAVESALSGAQRLRLNQQALDALAATASPDPARLAHHAAAAGDAEAVLRYAVLAARRASALGAHREAAEQYARAIAFAGESSAADPGEGLGELFDQRAYACYLSGDFPAALEAQRRALDHHRATGERAQQGAAARAMALLLRYDGDLDLAWELGQEAMRVLEPLGPSHELALTCATLSHLAVSAEDADQARVWGARAAELADRLGDVEVAVYVQLNLAQVALQEDDPSATASYEQALATALEHRLEEQAGRAYVNLVWWSPRGRRYAEADRYVEPGLAYCEERGLDLWRAYLLAYRARSALDRGRWDEAEASASLVLANPRTSPVPRVVANAVLGLLAARRTGDPAWPLLDQAWAAAGPTRELQRMEPAAVARAEALWLAGRDDEVAEATAATLDIAVLRGAAWVVGELAAWRRRAGLDVGASLAASEPFAAELRGDWAAARAAWQQLSAPYEAALVLLASDDEAVVRTALDQLRGLGAEGAVARATRRLRELGARAVPRGPRASTRENPAGLTARELEVARLVADGLRNQEVARRLTLAPRTVDHHVAAVLHKLGVASRGEVGSALRARGIDP
jgi:DNA-binding CsgD family transcriptional regulator